MILTRTQFAALVARNALIAVLVALLARPAVASTNPAAPINPPSAAKAAAADLPNAPLPPEGEPTSLHITILDGEGALNNIRQRTAREPIVQVEDQNHKPVAGVLIFFSIHGGSGGAGASFSGLSTLSVTTGPNGQAIAQGLLPNAHPGTFTINVSATHGNLSANTVIHQENILGAKSKSNSQSDQPIPPVVHSHKALKWSLAGGGAAAVVIILLLLDHNSGTNISAGSGGVGHP